MSLLQPCFSARFCMISSGASEEDPSCCYNFFSLGTIPNSRIPLRCKNFFAMPWCFWYSLSTRWMFVLCAYNKIRRSPFNYFNKN